jgi:hypothetical protein
MQQSSAAQPTPQAFQYPNWNVCKLIAFSSSETLLKDKVPVPSFVSLCRGK